MFKTIRDMAFGAFIAAAISSAFAVVGTPPIGGPGLVDSVWLNGLAAQQNNTFQSGLVAAGTNQATALQLLPGIALMEVDTAASSTGVALPACVAGSVVQLYNNGAQTLTIYPAIANNVLTSAQDTINNATSTTLATHVGTSFGCAKNGVWAAS